MNARLRYLVIFLAAMGALAVGLIPWGIPLQAQTVLAITFFVMVLWVSEALPLHVTALLASVLLIIFGGFKADQVFASYFDRVVVLVLGGFVLAGAMSRHKLDDYLSQKLLGKFGPSPKKMVLGVLCVTAAVSMWVSNSAAAALAMPIVLVILKTNKRGKENSPFAKSMVIAVAYGATIGGIGTLIGSTPNVLAQKFLTSNGVQFGFLEWSLRGFPFMVFMLIGTWIILVHLFKSEITRVHVHEHPHPFTREQKSVAGIFLLTVALWVTESIHGIHNSVIALFPVVLLSLFNLVSKEDFKRMGWDSLILIGGGIALGMSIESSGLSAVFAGGLGSMLSSQPLFVVLLAMGFIGIGFTSFISNTAASAILIPIVTSLAGVLGVDMTNLVMASAIGVSLDFIFPMGTPPTAIAHSTGCVHAKDIVKSGVLVSALGALLLAVLAFFTW